MGSPQLHTQTMIRQQTIFDPEVVERYSKLVPDAPERILKAFEENNRAERELRLLPHKTTARRDWMGFSVLIIIILSSVAFAFLGKSWQSLGALTGAIGIVGYSFLGKKRTKKEL